MSWRARMPLCDNVNVLSKPSESMLPQMLPTMKSKGRALTDASNKDKNISNLGAIGKPVILNKAAVERQRANASKLAAGRSVISKSDKENDVAKTKPVKPPVRPQKTKKTIDKNTSKLTKSESVISLFTHEETKKEVASVLEPKPQVQVKEEEDEVIPFGVNVIDGDEGVANNEFLLGVYARDIYKFLRSLEEKQNIRKEYLTSAHVMSPNMRSLLVDWLFEVQQSFKLLGETIQLAVALLDRFMQDHPNIEKNQLQLVGVACIFLAAKYEEMYPPDLDDLVDISAKTYSKQQILNMEQLIFSSLNYQMGRPSPSHFLRRYGRAGKVDVITYCFAKYFIDLSMVSYTMCHIPPSLIAAAALYLSMFILSDVESEHEFWTPTLVYYTQYNWNTLKPVVTQLANLVWNAPKSKYQTVRKKYLEPKRLYSVSARAELKSERLHKIATEV